MKNRTTPRIYDNDRGLFEESVRNRDYVAQQTIEFDVTVRNIQSVLTHDVPAGLIMLEELAVRRQSFYKQYANNPRVSASYTNLHRLLTGVEFAGDRSLAPFLFASNTHDIQRLRRHYTDGLEGRFVELIDGGLSGLADIHHDKIASAEYIRQVRGAIQEDTVAALLNSPQNGHFIVLPSSLEEDLYQGSDLLMYFIAEDGYGYRQGISVKSREQDAAAEKEKFPNLIVLHAEQFDNLKLSTSRLLTKRSIGSPGLTAEEDSKLQSITETLYLECINQIAIVPNKPILRQSSQTVGKLRQFILGKVQSV